MTQNNVLAFSRTIDPVYFHAIMTLVNFNSEATSVDFTNQLNLDNNPGSVILSTLGVNSTFQTE